MTPMIDTMLIPGTAAVVLSVGPVFLGVAVALVMAVLWLASGTAEELRRVAARDWEDGRPGIDRPSSSPDDRLAA